MFRGAKRPVNKECILIIDKVTGVCLIDRSCDIVATSMVVTCTGSSTRENQQHSAVEISSVRNQGGACSVHCCLAPQLMEAEQRKE